MREQSGTTYTGCVLAERVHIVGDLLKYNQQMLAEKVGHIREDIDEIKSELKQNSKTIRDLAQARSLIA